MMKLKNKRFMLCIGVVVFMLINIPLLEVQANPHTTSVGRYLTSNNQPLPEQKNLMLQTVEVHFPPEVKTVGEAIEYLLKPSGYILEPIDQASPKVKEMFAFNLPIVDRNFGPMTLQEALETLVGNSFGLRIDRLNRQVAFYLRGHANSSLKTGIEP